MATQTFINLPVKGLGKTTDFFPKRGSKFMDARQMPQEMKKRG